MTRGIMIITPIVKMADGMNTSATIRAIRKETTYSAEQLNSLF